MKLRLLLALVLALFAAPASAQQISALSAATALGGSELIPCDQSSVTVYCTPTQISTFVRAGPSTTLGAADASTATAQTLKVQGVVAGTSNTAGADFTIAGSVGTGTGAGGKIILKTAAAGSTGSTQNTLASALIVDSTGVTNVAAATATPAAGSTSARLLFGTTSGFGIYYGSGAPTVSAAQGSIYLRSDGSSTSTRLYVNSTGSTTWVNFTSAS